MIGGVNWPPHEAAASTAPAQAPVNPWRLISGIVKTPVPTTFATELPEIVPNKALAMIAACAAPPRIRDVTTVAILIRFGVALVASSSAPNRMKISTIEETMSVERPNTPLKPNQIALTDSSKEKPRCPNIPGISPKCA